MLVFEDNDSWRGKGILAECFADCTGFSDLFSKLIKETKEVGRVFERFISTDRGLIGQERFDLAEELEDLLGGYFLLYRLILGKEGEEFSSRFCGRDNTFLVWFEGYAWRAEGTLRQSAAAGSFAEWFNTTLLKKTSVLIQKFGASLADGEMDEGEREAVCRELNEAVARVISADRGLKSGELS